MKSTLSILVCLAVFVSAATALKCYNCHSTTLDGCTKSKKPTEQTCGAAAIGLPYCSYVVLYDTQKKTYDVKSGCEQISANTTPDKSNIAACLNPGQGIEVKDCRGCLEDLCNSASTYSTSMVTIMCLPLIYLVSKLF